MAGSIGELQLGSDPCAFAEDFTGRIFKRIATLRASSSRLMQIIIS